MKDQKEFNVKSRGLQVNRAQRGTNEKWEGKEFETRRLEVEKFENTKTTKCKKIHEIGVEDLWSC